MVRTRPQRPPPIYVPSVRRDVRYAVRLSSAQNVKQDITYLIMHAAYRVRVVQLSPIRQLEYVMHVIPHV